MNDFEKVVYPEPKPKQYEHYCPECGGGLEYGLIPCPDGRPGCCVAHFGYRCVGCGTVWRKSAQQYVQPTDGTLPAIQVDSTLLVSSATDTYRVPPISR